MRLFGIGVPGGFWGKAPGRHSISLHLKAPDCEKIDILNAFFLSEFFQYNDDFYGDFYGDTFVATNFLISLFLFFPLYDFNFILLASERASERASQVAPTDPPWLCAWMHFTKRNPQEENWLYALPSVAVKQAESILAGPSRREGGGGGITSGPRRGLQNISGYEDIQY